MPLLLSRCVARCCVVIAVMLLLAGCASVSIRDQQVSQEVKVTQPHQIYVALFDTESGEWRVDREGQELATFKQGTAQGLAEMIVTRLAKNVAPAEVYRPGMKMKPNSWLVTGRFTRVNQGSRILRAAIGFGLGGTKVETEVQVTQVQPQGRKQFMTFATTGGSNASPGAIASTEPISAAASLAMSAMPGLTDDLKRTARMVVASVSEYMAKREWIAPEKAQRPKREGQL